MATRSPWRAPRAPRPHVACVRAARFLLEAGVMPDVLSCEEIASALRAQRCPTDRAFDRLLPETMRVVSEEYWTPLRVGVRAACWFQELGVSSVVDIGAGVGKFCVVAALASSCRYVGVEQRARLVEAARALAQAFQLSERVDFVVGTLGEVPVPIGEAYYFYNPFGENLFSDGHLDDDVELGDERYERDVAAAEALLEHAPLGTYALTYNDFGGTMPAGYQMLRKDGNFSRDLCLWRKTAWRERRWLGPLQRIDGAACDRRQDLEVPSVPALGSGLVQQVDDGVDETERMRRTAGHE